MTRWKQVTKRTLGWQGTAALALLAFQLGSCATSGGGAKDQQVKVSQTERGVAVSVAEAVLFDTGKAVIKPDGLSVLERVSEVIRERSKKDVLVEGHTDNTGGAQMNQRLSEQRAAAVKQVMVDKGVETSRIRTVGLGSTRPLADNGTADGRRANRRTEVTLLGETTENIGGDNAVGFMEGAIGKLKGLGRSMIDFFKKKDSGDAKDSKDSKDSKETKDSKDSTSK